MLEEVGVLVVHLERVCWIQGVQIKQIHGRKCSQTEYI